MPPAAHRLRPPPAPEAIAHFVAAAERYGHWIGTPEENAALGLSMAPAA